MFMYMKTSMSVYQRMGVAREREKEKRGMGERENKKTSDYYYNCWGCEILSDFCRLFLCGVL